ncbi:MAG: HypC/HybG/HupF family hydrogenase formation chaperone [Alphaproteobacteria bacterium]|nr:HypC/HybG/HupF family hydrogenase formation chaperone [Alphaproteobacteria bacterium]
MCLGIPGRIEAITATEPLRMGRVRFGGIAKEVCLATVPEAGIGDWVVVHAGFAISVVDEAAAAEVLSWLRESP